MIQRKRSVGNSPVDHHHGNRGGGERHEPIGPEFGFHQNQRAGAGATNKSPHRSRPIQGGQSNRLGQTQSESQFFPVHRRRGQQTRDPRKSSGQCPKKVFRRTNLAHRRGMDPKGSGHRPLPPEPKPFGQSPERSAQTIPPDKHQKEQGPKDKEEERIKNHHWIEPIGFWRRIRRR
jgi:hypothetical protein